MILMIVSSSVNVGCLLLLLLLLCEIDLSGEEWMGNRKELEVAAEREGDAGTLLRLC